MARVLPMYLMAPDMSLEGTVIAEGMLANSEIVQCIKDVLES